MKFNGGGFFFTLFRECFKFGNRIIKISKIFLSESKFKFEFLGSNMFQ